MSKIIEFLDQDLDFDAVVDEIDVIVPKYLEAIECLAAAGSLDEILDDLQNTEAYWNRLVKLFDEIEPLEQDLPFEEIKRDGLQTELCALEQVYLRLNMQIEFSRNHWTKSLFNAAAKILNRMDFVLEGMGYPEEHEDRILIRIIRLRNQEKCQTWLLSQRSI